MGSVTVAAFAKLSKVKLASRVSKITYLLSLLLLLYLLNFRLRSIVLQQVYHCCLFCNDD